jgi:unsaturated rhamnogalacturonyl hydrolase
MTSRNLDLNSALESLVHRRPLLWKPAVCGVTCSTYSIPAILDQDAYAPITGRIRMLLVGGLSGRADDVIGALNALELFANGASHLSQRIALSAIPCGNLDQLMGNSPSGNGGSRDFSGGYPPPGNFYYDPEAPEKRYLWRWICFQAPDLLLEIRAGERVRWEGNDAVVGLPISIGAGKVAEEDSLLAALGRGKPDGLGPVPALRLTSPQEQLAAELGRLWDAIIQANSWPASPARQALDGRRSRPRLQVARILASVYGHRLDPVIYTQGVAISGRLRLARLDLDNSNSASEIAFLAEHCLLSDIFGDQPNGSTLAGVVWGYDLARATGDQRYADLLVRAANCYRPGDPGEAPPPCDADFRVEDMFYCGALLGRAFRITGDHQYLDVLTNFLLNCGTQRENGLFWHSRSAPYFWGRGNGFAALGFAEALTYLPQDHPQRSVILAMHLKHLDSLRQFQHPSGMYSQMLDVPGSYQEFTATCMIGYTMARGLRRGWLDASYREPLGLAWQGVSKRIDDRGNVVDACASTGVQQSVEDYLARPAIFGPDDRSGSMALWFAVELERLHRVV